MRPLAGLTFFWYFSDTVFSESANVAYEFGPFRLEPKEHRLVRKGCAIPLTGKAFATLCVLVQQHGALVPKQGLMDAVWPDSAVEENSLDRNISALRKALGEQASGESFIETCPGRDIALSARFARSHRKRPYRLPERASKQRLRGK